MQKQTTVIDGLTYYVNSPLPRVVCNKYFPNDGEICCDKFKGSVCTRTKDHEGDHVATGYSTTFVEYIIAIWENTTYKRKD